MEDMEYKKINFYNDDDINVDLQYLNGDLLLHCTVNGKYSKRVKEKLQEQFMVISELAYMEGFEEMFSYTQNLKFANLIYPCEVIGEVPHSDYKVVRWDLK